MQIYDFSPSVDGEKRRFPLEEIYLNPRSGYHLAVTHMRDSKISHGEAVYHILRSRIYHPFIPLLLTPCMIYLRRNRNTRKSGRETSATAAICTG